MDYEELEGKNTNFEHCLHDTDTGIYVSMRAKGFWALQKPDQASLNFSIIVEEWYERTCSRMIY